MKNKDIKLENINFEDEGPIYMASKRAHSDCSIVLYGVPYDGTTSFRPGTRFGPNAIKSVSSGLETFCPQLNLDLESINFADFGNLEIPFSAPEQVIKKVQYATEYIYSLGAKPLLLGGEHSSTIGAIEGISKYFPDLILLQLDAHADLREEWLGSKYNHACTIRRCLEILPSKKIYQLGIRSGTKEEIQEIKQMKRLIRFSSGQPSTELRETLKPYMGKPIYLTLDLDWFDPSVLPGTGTPEPGGFFWQD